MISIKEYIIEILENIWVLAAEGVGSKIDILGSW